MKNPTLTYDNISAALETLSNDELEYYLEVYNYKLTQLDQQNLSTEEIREKMITYWLRTYPIPTWEDLAGKLYYVGEKISLEKVKKYIHRNLEPSLTLENLMNVLVKVKDWYELSQRLQIPKSKIIKLYTDISKRDLLKIWLDNHPSPTWDWVCHTLYWMKEYDILEIVQMKYYKGTYLIRRHLQIAMEKGKGKTSVTKVVLFGSSGSGKTCTTHVILDEDPPDEYTSTPLAVRPVKLYHVDITPSQWKKLSRKEQNLVIANACYEYDVNQAVLQDFLDHNKKVHQEQHPANEVITTEHSNAAVSDMPIATQDLPVDESTPKAKHEASSLNSIPALETYDDFLACMEKCSTDDRVAEIKRVQIADCGGQPQFHEILPVFITGTSLYLFVFKLNEELASYPLIRYHVDGKSICPPYESTETNEQILEHCLRVVRSQKALNGNSSSPRIMIIGTHKDKEHECKSETRKIKNSKLVDILLPEFRNEVIYFCLRPSKQLVFALNAKYPGDDEKQIADVIRRLVSTECAAQAVEIPLQWHGLEVLLEDLAKALKRDIISKAQCVAAAQNLHFEDESALDAALEYLHHLNLIFYYPDILPEVIFASAQVLLDKVTELVIAAHEVRSGKTAIAMSKLQDEKWQKFCDYALVSAEFLAQEEFKRHYISGLFMHDHLMLLFRKLLIFAEFSESEVFVPALLQKLRKEELDKHRVSCRSAIASPLLFTFPKQGGPLLGVFCASVVALLSNDNIHPSHWMLMKEDDNITPTCLYRNCVQFMIKSYPGSVMLIDSFEHIEVHIHITTKAAARMNNFPGFCRTIRCSIVNAIRKATLALHYDYDEPEIGFGCPCNRPTFHLATIGADLNTLICSKNNDESCALEAHQNIWIEKEHTQNTIKIDCTYKQVKQNTSSESNVDMQDINKTIDSVPKLHELYYMEHHNRRVRVVESVAARWERVAAQLHFEIPVVEIIQRDAPSQSEAACQMMFSRWLDGVGRKPKTWRTLIAALNEADLAAVADEVKGIICW